jgi:hypothetical protein
VQGKKQSVAQAFSLWGLVGAGSTGAITKTRRLKVVAEKVFDLVILSEAKNDKGSFSAAC